MGKWMKAVIIILIIVILLFIGYKLGTRNKVVDYGEEVVLEKGQLGVSFLSVGQGDCMVIRLDGKVMVIDSGDSDSGESIVEYLHKNRINTLDYLVLTHPDIDHIGGATKLMNNLYVKKLLMPKMRKGTWTYLKTGTTIKARRVKVEHPLSGAEYAFGEAKIKILNPAEVVSKEYNNSSMVIKLTYGKKTFLFSADAEKEAEEYMVEQYGDELRCDVLKLGHHGSFTASSKEYLDAADPVWGVVSCGRWNIYGHPHGSVMTRVKKKGIQVLRTDQQGTVTALCDGESIKWKCEFNLK